MRPTLMSSLGSAMTVRDAERLGCPYPSAERPSPRIIAIGVDLRHSGFGQANDRSFTVRDALAAVISSSDTPDRISISNRLSATTECK